MEIVGLIPAGGHASRLGKIPCSKEVFPIFDKDGNIKVVSSHLIAYFRRAGIDNIFYIIRKGKWDIPEYFGDGSEFDVNITYLLTNLPFGTPFTIDQAFPFVKNSIIALGFPDILFHPEDAFAELKNSFIKNNDDLLLGIVPCTEYLKTDMVDFNENGEIRNIVIKQNRPDLKYSWFIAMWRPAFSQYLHDYLKLLLKQNPDGLFRDENKNEREIYIGDVIRSAIHEKMKVSYIIFDQGGYVDLGTPSAIFNNSR